MTEVGEGHGHEHFCALPPVDAQRAATLEQAANTTQYLGTQQETACAFRCDCTTQSQEQNDSEPS